MVFRFYFFEILVHLFDHVALYRVRIYLWPNCFHMKESSSAINNMKKPVVLIMMVFFSLKSSAFHFKVTAIYWRLFFLPLKHAIQSLCHLTNKNEIKSVEICCCFKTIRIYDWRCLKMLCFWLVFFVCVCWILSCCVQCHSVRYEQLF